MRLRVFAWRAVPACMLAAALAIPLHTGRAAGGAADDWTTYLGSNGRTGYNASDTSITPQATGSLRLAWTARSQGGAISTQPIVWQGRIFWSAWDGYVRASTLQGSSLWQQNLGQTTVRGCNPPSAGVASTGTITTIQVSGVATPALLIGGGDAQFYALNALTGQVIWKRPLGQYGNNFLWGSPAVYGGSVYEGVASFGDCPLMQGQLVKMDAATGVVRGVFKAVPDGCTGAGIWGAPAIDEATGTIFVTTGNDDVHVCKLPEPYVASILALRASDLGVVGSWAVPPSSLIFDGDFGSTPTLFSAPVRGTSTPRPLVGVVNKNGYFYAFDRTALSAGPVWSTRIADPGSTPQDGDGSVVPAAWDGSRLYVGGGFITLSGRRCQGSVDALDPASGRPLWQHCTSLVLGAIMARPGLVEAGAGNHISIFSARTGGTMFVYTVRGATVYGAGTISNGLLLQGDTSGRLYAFSPGGSNLERGGG